MIKWDPPFKTATFAPDNWPLQRVGPSSGWPLKRGFTTCYSGPDSDTAPGTSAAARVVLQAQLRAAPPGIWKLE